MEAYLGLIVVLILYGGLAYVRGAERGGKFGKMIRNSDWHAWKIAVEEKERELADLRLMEPKR